MARRGAITARFTASRLGYAHADNLIGIHLNFLAIPRDLPLPAEPTEEERGYFAQLAVWLKEETGYQWIQGTKPQTLAYGLTDSPAGLAAWIVEKFRTWTDCGGDPESVDQPRSDAGEYFAVLVHGCDRVIVLAVLRAYARTMADPQRWNGRCADWLLCVSEGDYPAAALRSLGRCTRIFSAGR